mmetsp:Transcript_17175/g.36934  ORF Transcript_17175/g.36934 Transcript_17175/m.36934 type:complete len:476 (-) Transcript_17175:22-1449(-)
MADPPVELEFLLVVGNEDPKRFSLVGLEDTILIGRASDADVKLTSTSVSSIHCHLMLKRKNRDPQLCVMDTSRNKTGVRHPRVSNPNPEWTDLKKDDVEVLNHRSELLVPGTCRRSRPGNELRTRVQILFVLPDNFDPWRKVGRFDYLERLGEGGLAVVYRAKDMYNEGRMVAVKVSKFRNLPAASNMNRHIYALHREARWSMERLHNKQSPKYETGGAVLFARYLEDHTGFGVHAPSGDFEALRTHFENKNFSWAEHKFQPPLAHEPYVVMEFIDGSLLQNVIDHGPALSTVERRAVVRQCTKALVYMERFSVIHRDFRGCNIFMVGLGPRCSIKVIDLGFMIAADASNATNPNPAIRCAWQGDPAKKVRFDWAPPEVRTRGAPNFGLPPASFDIYSFGVLLLKLLRGRAWTQDALKYLSYPVQLKHSSSDLISVGLSVDTLVRMLNQDYPKTRPTATALLLELNQNRTAVTTW